MVTKEKDGIMPVFKVRHGRAQCAVFERERDGNNGKFMSKSIALQVGYNKAGEWKNQNMTIIRSDLQNVISALEAAKTAMVDDMVVM